MEKIIAIFASPNTEEGSRTYALMQAFVQAYLALHDDAQVRWVDLNEDKTITSQVLNVNNFESWFSTAYYADEILKANKLIIGTPVNNFTTSTMIRNWFDRISIPGKVFKYDNEGNFVPLLNNLKVQILVTKGLPKDADGELAIQFLTKGFKSYGATINQPILIDKTNSKENINLKPEQIVTPYLDEIKSVASKF